MSQGKAYSPAEVVFGCDHILEDIITHCSPETQASWLRVCERTFDLAGKHLYGNVDLKGVCMTGFFRGASPMLESGNCTCSAPDKGRKRRLLAHVRQLAITRPLDAAAILYLQRLGDMLPNVEFDEDVFDRDCVPGCAYFAQPA